MAKDPRCSLKSDLDTKPLRILCSVSYRDTTDEQLIDDFEDEASTACQLVFFQGILDEDCQVRGRNTSFMTLSRVHVQHDGATSMLAQNRHVDSV